MRSGVPVTSASAKIAQLRLSSHASVYVLHLSFLILEQGLGKKTPSHSHRTVHTPKRSEQEQPATLVPCQARGPPCGQCRRSYEQMKKQTTCRLHSTLSGYAE